MAFPTSLQRIHFFVTVIQMLTEEYRAMSPGTMEAQVRWLNFEFGTNLSPLVSIVVLTILDGWLVEVSPLNFRLKLRPFFRGELGGG